MGGDGLEDQLRHLAEVVPLIVLSAGRDGVITRAFGRSSGAGMVGRTIDEVFEGQGWLLDAAHRALAGEVVRASGAVGGSWYDLQCIPRREQGDVVGLIAVALDASERRAAEEAIERTRSRDWTVLESALDAVLVMDRRGLLLDINSAAERLFGYRRDDVLGRDIAEVMVPERLREAQRESLTRYLETGEPTLIGRISDIRAMRADGSEFPAELAVTRLAGQGPPVFVGYVRDVSLRRMVERQLESSLSILRSTIESTGDAILVVDLDHRVTLHNRKLVEMWGIPPEILESREADKALAFVLGSVRDPKGVSERARSLYEDPEAQGTSVTELKDGRVIERFSMPQRVGDQVVGRVWSFRDITARVHAEEDLRRRTAEMKAVLDSMVDLVVACDTRGVILLLNHAARQLLGERADDGRLTVADLIAVTRMRNLDGEPVTVEDHPLSKALRGETWTQEDYLLDPPGGGGPRIIRHNTSPVRDERGQAVAAVGVSRDVTQVVELSLLKDQFVRVAAHELKTPVAVMKSYAQLALRHGTGVDPDLARMLRAIDRGASRIDGLVRNLLDISQLVVGRLPLGHDRVDLGALVEEATTKAAGAAPRHHVQTQVTPLVVEGDRERIAGVLDVLVANAIRYSPEGGDVEVRLQQQEHEAVLEVHDHGVGIPREKQARIFERFYRAHSGTPYDYGGMGVGLYIAREVILQHGGRMWFESHPGEGSRFFVALPLPGKAS